MHWPKAITRSGAGLEGDWIDSKLKLAIERNEIWKFTSKKLYSPHRYSNVDSKGNDPDGKTKIQVPTGSVVMSAAGCNFPAFIYVYHRPHFIDGQPNERESYGALLTDEYHSDEEYDRWEGSNGICPRLDEWEAIQRNAEIRTEANKIQSSRRNVDCETR